MWQKLITKTFKKTIHKYLFEFLSVIIAQLNEEFAKAKSLTESDKKAIAGAFHILERRINEKLNIFG
jgi:hypothetical protein